MKKLKIINVMAYVLYIVEAGLAIKFLYIEAYMAALIIMQSMIGICAIFLLIELLKNLYQKPD